MRGCLVLAVVAAALALAPSAGATVLGELVVLEGSSPGWTPVTLDRRMTSPGARGRR